MPPEGEAGSGMALPAMKEAVNGFFMGRADSTSSLQAGSASSPQAGSASSLQARVPPEGEPLVAWPSRP